MTPEIGRLVALDVRAQRIGYVVLEAPEQLLAWGMRSSGARYRAGWIADLIRLYQPSAVVIRAIKRGHRRDTPGSRRIVSAIRREARHSSVAVVFVTDAARKKLFSRYGKPTKYQIAPLLAAKFPELKARLPPPKRRWKPEPRKMSVFDAAQAGIVCLASRMREESIRGWLTNT
jgi:hypothetical protein